MMKNNVRQLIRSGVLYESSDPNIEAISIRYDYFLKTYEFWGVRLDRKTNSLDYFQMDPKVNYLSLSEARSMVCESIRYELDEETGLQMPVRWVNPI